MRISSNVKKVLTCLFMCVPTYIDANILEWMTADLSSRVCESIDTTDVMFANFEKALQAMDQAGEDDSTMPSIPDGGFINTDMIELDFNNVSMKSVLDFISGILLLNFIYKDGELDFPVTISAPNKVKISDLQGIILKVLNTNGLGIEEFGDNIYISRLQDVSSGMKVSEIGEESHFYTTKVFALFHIPAEDAAKIVRPLLSSGSHVGVVADYLVVTDSIHIMDRVSALIKTIDTAGLGFVVREYKVVNAEPFSMSDLAFKIMAPFIVGKAFVLVPYERQKKIFIVSSELLADKAYAILESLDGPMASSATGVESLREASKAYVYRVKYQQPAAILSVLNEWGSMMTEERGASELANALKGVFLVGGSNILTYYAKPNIARSIEAIIDTLDFPFGVVSIDVLILETSMSMQYSFGVDWAGNTRDPAVSNTGEETPNKVIGLGSLDTNQLGSMIGKVADIGVRLAKGFSWSAIGNVLTFQGISFDNVGAFINAVNQDSESHIVWSPNITSSDMNEASVFFGQQIPVKTSTTSVRENTTEYQDYTLIDVGATLRVQASIGSSGGDDGDWTDSDVTMKVYQEISEVNTNAAYGVGEYPVTSKYTVNTTVRVPNDAFLLLSGMSREASSTESTGVPCGNIFCNFLRVLSKILGGSIRQSSSKRCLMVFVRPHIISGVDDIERINRDKIELLEDSDVNMYDLDRKLDDLRKAREKSVLEQLQGVVRRAR